MQKSNKKQGLNHVDLHNLLSDTLTKLKTGKITQEDAKEIFNGGNSLIRNCKNEIQMIQMGVHVDVPLLGIKKEDVKKHFKEIPAIDTEAAVAKIRKKIGH